jgi:hypothetical protein
MMMKYICLYKYYIILHTSVISIISYTYNYLEIGITENLFCIITLKYKYKIILFITIY